MFRRLRRGLVLALLPLALCAGVAQADTSLTVYGDEMVMLAGPASAHVGEPAMFTAACGTVADFAACPLGEFRAFGGRINRLGEGFGTGFIGYYTFRAPGVYSVRYRVGAHCIGSPRLSCPIDAWISTTVTA